MIASADAKKPVVIYRLGSLGDTVVALPCFHKIAQVWPDAERIVLTNFPVSSNAAPLEVILRESKLIQSAIAYPVGTRSIRELWRLSRILRRVGADTLVYLTPARGLFNAYRDWLFFKACGFKHIIGAPLTASLQQPRRIGSGPPGQRPVEERECERLVRCLRSVGEIDLDDAAMWDLCITDREANAAAIAVAPLEAGAYFAVNMGGKAQEKDWGVKNWCDLLKRLSARYPDTALLVVGAAEDSPRVQRVAGSWAGLVVDACGRLTPRESAAAMRGALAFIGHDSGPLHLAAAMRVSCVGLFGNFNQPNRWHPRGRQHRIIHKMSGLNDITVTEVLDAVGDVVPLSLVTDFNSGIRGEFCDRQRAL